MTFILSVYDCRETRKCYSRHSASTIFILISGCTSLLYFTISGASRMAENSQQKLARSDYACRP